MQKGELLMKKSCIILVLSTVIVSTSCGKNKVSESITENHIEIESNITEATETKVSDETVEFSAIDKFIELYNNSASIPIDSITKMDIQGDDYKTEFRLNAYKNAVGKKGAISDSLVEIVNYGSWSNDSIRIYIYATSLDSAIDIYTSTVHIFDNSITNEEIVESYSSLNTTGTTNIYLGSSGYISGYIGCDYSNGGIVGYDVMIDCSELNYMD